MKRITSLLLSIVMAMGLIFPCQSVIAAEIERKSVSLFSNRVEEMNAEYESDSDSLEANANKKQSQCSGG